MTWDRQPDDLTPEICQVLGVNYTVLFWEVIVPRLLSSPPPPKLTTQPPPLDTPPSDYVPLALRLNSRSFDATPTYGWRGPLVDRARYYEKLFAKF
jgi:hypothetical protein